MTTEVIMFSRTEPPCHGCSAMKPIMENVPNGRVVDVYEEPELVQRYRIMSLPTFIKLKDGEFDSMKSGAMPKQQFIDWVAK